MEIIINNLNFNNYKLSGLSLSDGFSYGVIGKNQDDVEKLLKILAGINDNDNTCTIDSESIYDNKEYFKSRIYLDFKLRYFNSIDVKTVKEDINFHYNTFFNEKEYKRLVNELGIRAETKITNKYEISDLGNNLNNIAVSSAIDSKRIIAIDPFIYIDENKKELREKIINLIINRKKYNMMIVDAKNLKEMYPYLDYLIILGDFNECIMIKPNSDKFIISDDYIILRNKIFKKDNIVISKAPTEKEDYKELKRILKKYKEISFIDAYSYYMGDK